MCFNRHSEECGRNGGNGGPGDTKKESSSNSHRRKSVIDPEDEQSESYQNERETVSPVFEAESNLKGMDKFKKDVRRIQQMQAHERDPNLSFEEVRFMQNYLNSLLSD